MIFALFEEKIMEDGRRNKNSKRNIFTRSYKEVPLVILRRDTLSKA